ncbi:hypothetical protein [Nakamurella sp.]|uniref:hypothetical protein n=1 Tax=Nakamurella sp. TaxID=1869182 RepID=UPI003784A793
MSPAGDGPGDEDLARLAAAAASAVPGVVRLQPGLRHLAGRAARALFTGDDAHDDEADRSGISVDHEPGPHVTVRIVVAAAPPPRRTAEQVHSAVERALSQVTGPGLTVTVVMVDVEP